MSQNLQVDPDLYVSPKNLRGRKGKFQLVINNRKKVALTYNLKASDPGQLCNYQFSTDNVTLEPGATATADLTVSYKTTPLVGVLKVCNFTVTATTITREVETTEGQLECPPRLPIWAAAIGALVLLAIIAVPITLVNMNKSSGTNSTSTKAYITSGWTSSANQGFTDMGALAAYALIQTNLGKSSFVILDVRGPLEFQSGHIQNAVNIKVESTDFSAQIAQYDKTKTYLVYCMNGNRSRQAATTMASLGFKHIFNLMDGLYDWQANGYTLVK